MNIYSKQNDVEGRRMQVVYMYHELNFTPKQIAQYVALAVSTIRSYAFKFANLLEKARQYFGEKTKELINIAREKTKAGKTITFDCPHKIGTCAYIIEYFNSQKEFIFLKVGETNNIERRVKEHLKAYSADFDATYAVVKQLFYTAEDDDALTMENTLRKHYKKKENGGFLPRDRFLFLRYNKEDIEQDKLISAQYKLCTC